MECPLYIQCTEWSFDVNNRGSIKGQTSFIVDLRRIFLQPFGIAWNDYEQSCQNGKMPFYASVDMVES